MTTFPEKIKLEKGKDSKFKKLFASWSLHFGCSISGRTQYMTDADSFLFSWYQ